MRLKARRHAGVIIIQWNKDLQRKYKLPLNFDFKLNLLSIKEVNRDDRKRKV